MSIELVRIDDRLIHGQVVMAWSRAMSIERLVVIDDKVATDEIQKILLKTVAPSHIKVSILTAEEGIEALQGNKFGNEALLVLVTNPQTIIALIGGGVKISTVNIGGMSFNPGKTQVTKAVFVDAQERNAFEKLHAQGVALQIQMLPNDTPIDIMTELE